MNALRVPPKIRRAQQRDYIEAEIEEYEVLRVSEVHGSRPITPPRHRNYPTRACQAQVAHRVSIGPLDMIPDLLVATLSPRHLGQPNDWLDSPDLAELDSPDLTEEGAKPWKL
jgi:hypothetical protein